MPPPNSTARNRRVPWSALALAAFLHGAVGQVASSHETAAARVTPIPQPVIGRFMLETTFYQKHVDYEGFSTLGSDKMAMLP